MRQNKLIHEHYDSKPWASIISGSLLAGIAILKLLKDRGEHSWLYLIIFGICLLPTVALLVMDIIWKKKPTLVVYNDCLEVWKPMSSKRVEILYSQIKNMALQSGQLRVWLDEYSQPACYNLGANANKAQESYDILRNAYDQYNQEHNFKTVPLPDLPKRKLTAQVLIMIVTFCLISLFLIIEHFR
ncbi:MAG: hypothetical protein J6T18_07065 [Bacteroidaceae bacterium]|nr:hypothetical protein [Bacteroidaceae bacterium]